MINKNEQVCNNLLTSCNNKIHNLMPQQFLKRDSKWEMAHLVAETCRDGFIQRFWI